MQITDFLSLIASGGSLSFDQAKELMNQITEGEAKDSQIAAALMGMRVRGETVDEIAGFAFVMRQKCTRIYPTVSGRLTDTAGTGGGTNKTFNISTVAAFVASGAGIPIAKHGNRSTTSQCGSADLVEELGARILLPPDRVRRIIEEVGIGFMFAPAFHPSMKYAIGPRRDLAISTAFNVLGPLTNPAGAAGQLIGVYDPRLVEKVARALARLGTEKALVVHGGGIDELSTLGPTTVGEVNGGQVRMYEIDPGEFGIRLAEPQSIAGGDPAQSAALAKAILSGEPGARRDITLLNAGAAVYVGGGADSLGEGIAKAQESIDHGSAMKKMKAFVDATRIG